MCIKIIHISNFSFRYGHRERPEESLQRKGRTLCKQGNEVSAVGEAEQSDTVNLYDRNEFKSNLFL